jgi:ERF superfamily
LNNNGIYLMQKSHDCENGVKVETILLHESGEQFSGGILHVPASKNDPQGYGSALTYARRYSLMATCGIAPEDDDGNAASKQTFRNTHGDASGQGYVQQNTTVKHVLDVPANDITPEQVELMKEKAAEIVHFCSHNLLEDAFVVYDNVSDMAERNELWKLLAPNSAVRAKLKAIGTEKRNQSKDKQ